MERVRVIAEILQLRKEQEMIRVKQATMSTKKTELIEIYDSVKTRLREHAAQELDALSKERANISKRAVTERAKLQQDYQTELSHILRKKEESERSLEAESEFLGQNMQNRLEILNKKIVDLRFELNHKRNEFSQTLAAMTPEELVKAKIESNYDLCQEMSKTIGSLYSTTEGLTFKTERLKSILQKTACQMPENHFGSEFLNKDTPRRRRFSNATIHKVRRPSF